MVQIIKEEFIITLYEYNTLSYSGIGESHYLIFSDKDIAESFISDKGLRIVKNVKNPLVECTLHKQELLTEFKRYG